MIKKSPCYSPNIGGPNLNPSSPNYSPAALYRVPIGGNTGTGM